MHQLTQGGERPEVGSRTVCVMRMYAWLYVAYVLHITHYISENIQHTCLYVSVFICMPNAIRGPRDDIT
jgi:hypothetical protein